jgi:hypothetical protein
MALETFVLKTCWRKKTDFDAGGGKGDLIEKYMIGKLDSILYQRASRM